MNEIECFFPSIIDNKRQNQLISNFVREKRETVITVKV